MSNLSIFNNSNFSSHLVTRSIVDPAVLKTWWILNLLLLCLAFSLFSMLLSALLIQGQLKSGSGLLILHQVLAEGQMAIVHFFLFLLVTYKSQTSFYVNDSFCHHYYSSYMITVAACQYGIMILALNRFVALFFPSAYKSWTRTWVLGIMVASSWFYGIICHIYFYFGRAGGEPIVSKAYELSFLRLRELGRAEQAITD